MPTGGFVELRPGVKITSRLRLVRLIGKGGMGSVWVAFHESLGTEVAVKFVDVAIARSNPAVVERFNREAGIAAKLKNPHVAQTYDHGLLQDGTPYIVMELLEGESLHARIKRSGSLSLYETSLVVSQTAQALGKAHKKGIVHRDVKPGNLFCVDTDYEIFIKLLDFGIAKHSGGLNKVELTNTRNLLGSPLYMSPEQFTRAKGVDWRGDLWSLAVVAYRCLTGVPPFTGEAIGQVIVAVMSGKYKPVTELKPLLPVTLDHWFAKAFHPDINERFQSTKELASTFAEACRASMPEARGSLPSITEMTRDAPASQKDHEPPAELLWSDPEVPQEHAQSETAPLPGKPAAPETGVSDTDASDTGEAAAVESTRSLPGTEPAPQGIPRTAPKPTVPRPAATESLAAGADEKGVESGPLAEATTTEKTAVVQPKPPPAKDKPQRAQLADKQTIKLTQPWRGSESAAKVTARLTKADIPQVAPLLSAEPVLDEESTDVVTFSPAATTIGGGKERKLRAPLWAGAAVMLIAGGLGAYVLMSGEGAETTRPANAASGTPAGVESSHVSSRTDSALAEEEPPPATLVESAPSAVEPAPSAIEPTPSATSSAAASAAQPKPQPSAWQHQPRGKWPPPAPPPSDDEAGF